MFGNCYKICPGHFHGSALTHNTTNESVDANRVLTQITSNKTQSQYGEWTNGSQLERNLTDDYLSMSKGNKFLSHYYFEGHFISCTIGIENDDTLVVESEPEKDRLASIPFDSIKAYEGAAKPEKLKNLIQDCETQNKICQMAIPVLVIKNIAAGCNSSSYHVFRFDGNDAEKNCRRLFHIIGIARIFRSLDSTKREIEN